MEEFSENKKGNKGDQEFFDKQIWWIAGDYPNETHHVLRLLQENKIEDLKKRGLKNLEQTYLDHLTETKSKKENFKKKFNSSIDEYFTEMTKSQGKEMLPIFWKKKEQLDKLVNEFNEELKKEKSDTIILKKIFNQMYKIIYGSKGRPDQIKPFPEVQD